MKLSTNAQADHAWFAACLANKELVARLRALKLFIIDIDGTLTDAGIAVSAEKEEFRVFSIQDGYIIEFCHEANLILYLMSGKRHGSGLVRGRGLKIPEDHIILGTCEDKCKAIEALRAKHNVSIEQTAMIGDDWLDAKPKTVNAVGMYIAPANAPFYFQNIADIVLPRAGGHDALRIFMDVILYIHGKHPAQALIASML